MMIFRSLGISLLLTLLIEVPLVYGFKIPVKLGVLVNILTNPIVVLCYHWGLYFFQDFPYHLILLVAFLELFAVFLEAYFYKESHPHPFYCSLLFNSISFSIGLLL